MIFCLVFLISYYTNLLKIFPLNSLSSGIFFTSYNECISFYLCITNYQQFSSIKQHIYYILVSASREPRHSMTWFLVRPLSRWLPTLDPHLRLSYVMWERSDSKFIWLLIEFNFLRDLLFIGCRPEATLSPLPSDPMDRAAHNMALSFFKAKQRRASLSKKDVTVFAT